MEGLRHERSSLFSGYRRLGCECLRRGIGYEEVRSKQVVTVAALEGVAPCGKGKGVE
jgi:hypothetical protein